MNRKLINLVVASLTVVGLAGMAAAPAQAAKPEQRNVWCC